MLGEKYGAIVCKDDAETVRHGFLWLKKKQVKLAGLTKGKTYRVYSVMKNNYGSAFVSYEFIHYLIQDDTGIKQWHDGDRF